MSGRSSEPGSDDDDDEKEDGGGMAMRSMRQPAPGATLRHRLPAFS